MSSVKEAGPTCLDDDVPEAPKVTNAPMQKLLDKLKTTKFAARKMMVGLYAITFAFKSPSKEGISDLKIRGRRQLEQPPEVNLAFYTSAIFLLVQLLALLLSLRTSILCFRRPVQNVSIFLLI